MENTSRHTLGCRSHDLQIVGMCRDEGKGARLTPKILTGANGFKAVSLPELEGQEEIRGLGYTVSIRVS